MSDDCETGFSLTGMVKKTASDAAFLTKSYVWTRGIETMVIFKNAIRDEPVTIEMRRFLNLTNFNVTLLNLIKSYLDYGRCFFQVWPHPERGAHFNWIHPGNVIEVQKDAYGDIDFTVISSCITVSQLLSGVDDGRYDVSDAFMKQMKKMNWNSVQQTWNYNNIVNVRMAFTSSYEKAKNMGGNPMKEGKYYVVTFYPGAITGHVRKNINLKYREVIGTTDYDNTQLHIAEYPLRNYSNEPIGMDEQSRNIAENFQEVKKAVLDGAVMNLRPPMKIIGDGLKYDTCIDLNDYGTTTIEGNAEISRVLELSGAVQIGSVIADKEEANLKELYGLNRLIDTYATTVQETVARQSVRGMHMQTVSEEIYQKIIRVMIEEGFEALEKKYRDAVGFVPDEHRIVFEGLASDDAKAEHIQKIMAFLNIVSTIANFDQSAIASINSSGMVRELASKLNISSDNLRDTDGTTAKITSEDILKARGGLGEQPEQ